MSVTNSSFFLLKNGTVKSTGANYYGQLGLGDKTNRKILTLIPNLKNVKQIAGGAFHTVFLLNDGTVKACGSNQSGQSGLGDDIDNIYIPTLIPDLNNVKQISCGGSRTTFLLNDGTVKTCGYNPSGQLGVNNYKTYLTIPTLIPNLNNVKQIACGYSTNLFLLNDGTVKVCGSNGYGQLGLGDVTDRNTPTIIPNLDNVKHISGGGYHTVFLLNNGTVKVCGYNYKGQLGLDDITSRNIPILIPNLDNVKQISCGYEHTLFLLNDGTMKSCGRNDHGQLGLGDVTDRNTPTIIPNLDNVKHISGGGYHTVFLLNNGNVKGCGYNGEGQLGLGDERGGRYKPTLIPDLSDVTLLDMEKIYFYKYLLRDKKYVYGFYNDEKVIVDQMDLEKVKQYGLDDPNDIVNKNTEFDGVLKYIIKD